MSQTVQLTRWLENNKDQISGKSPLKLSEAIKNTLGFQAGSKRIVVMCKELGITLASKPKPSQKTLDTIIEVLSDLCILLDHKEGLAKLKKGKE